MHLPLSKIQEQFWVLGNLYPTSTAYNIPLVYKLEGKLCLKSFKEALIAAFQKHTLLGTKIIIEDNSPYIESPSNFDINDYFECLHISEKCTSQNYNEHILAEVHRLFKLSGDFLTRIKFFSFSDSDYIVFVFHHIVVDHHSKFILLSDISKYYSYLLQKIPITIEDNEMTSEYESYIEHEKNWLSSNEASKMRGKWESVFEKNIAPIDLPFDRNNEMLFKSKGKRLHFKLFNELSTRIKHFSEINNISPFVFFLSVYSLFLSRISEQRTFAIGVPLSNRRNENFKNTFGCFVNILPIIVNLEKESTFSDILKIIRVELLQNHRRQEIPLVDLQSIYNENQKGYPFHVGFTFEGPVNFSLENILVEPEVIERQGAQLELFLTLWESKNGYNGFWEFNSDKFKDTTGQRYISIFKTLINDILDTNNKHYLEYSIIPEWDQNLITKVNATQCDYSDKICIHEVFENKAAEIPNHTAIIHAKVELSYKELNIHVNQLANYLIEINTQVGDIIAIACERRVEMIISILAILKSGATYLPIQVNNPAQVNQEIFNVAQPKYILASSYGSINLKNKGQVISIEKILDNPYSLDCSNPKVKVNSENLAYIIFTSGSTGIPKGVAIKHHSVINRIQWMQKSYPLTGNDVLLQKTPITFDVSVWELFWWFFGGAKLSLLEHDGEKDPMLIIESIEEYGVTKIHFVPSMFVFFIDALKKLNLTAQIKSIETIFCSGESLQTAMVKSFKSLESASPLAKVVNLYGPTEATVDVSYYNCPDYIQDTDKIFIGRPVDNTELYVVNEKLTIQPVGVKGELIITGANLAQGYINNDELTRTHFVKFNKLNGEQVTAYKTGDIAVLNRNGEIEYCGRKDKQVKIRGIRIELGEIESKLLKHPKVTSTAVSLLEEVDSKIIIAYVVLKQHQSISELTLINDLKKMVAPIMLPSRIIFMKKLPLNSSGKIDRKELPKPPKHVVHDSFTKPDTYYEKELSNLWYKLLKKENIQVNDNFYDIGGDSLLAIKLSMNIATTFSIEPNVISIMEYPTIKDYAQFLESKILHKHNVQNNVIEEHISRSESMRRRFSQNRKNSLS